MNMNGDDEIPKNGEKQDLFHVIHKLPTGDSPYVRAKYMQLVEKDSEAAIVMFWKAINAGDRIDSALKDMAVVMKQMDRAEEAIEAIKSFRQRCSKQAQESLDNVLIDLYKKCGKLDEQIELLKQKLRMIYQGEAFNGKATKTARSHGRKFQVTLKQETCRILGNLGWAYMQQMNYVAAEIVYRKAQEIEPDHNKGCNLCSCLIKQGKYKEARVVLSSAGDGGDLKSRNRAEELMKEIEDDDDGGNGGKGLGLGLGLGLEDAFIEGIDQLMGEWIPLRSRRLPIFEEIISQYNRDQLAC
ncbi:protein SULFUR DEFICIENCY-INDUCED 2-like [Impatiens glandulifera]|uniref:protein SULFUR DEFICIENCY-INDUCED 2-like n=1 Tax=Impatiens glandulifera TaxID=253017 RepID=UPI001FB1192A|nr:protein SULFUR DEFICIENCY-INDUCED 2-like [Impatiens glandulifera]XP_047317168.1 protein SULFUR DEFICIENCY-INDUCED 2-like [Impatiens glandulifera]